MYKLIPTFNTVLELLLPKQLTIWPAIIAGGAAVAGGALSAWGSGKAADAAGSANDANIAFQKDIYKRQQENLAPYLESGKAGLSSYMERLGYTQKPLALKDNDRAMDIVRDFRQQVTSGQEGPARTYIAQQAGANTWEDLTDDQVLSFLTSGKMNADMERQYGTYATDLQKLSDDMQWEGGDDVARYGLDDLQLDPGYNFRLSEGISNMDKSASASGMNLSGSTLKGLNRYNQNFASNEFGAAFNRNQTELGNLWALSGQGAQAASGQNMNLSSLGQNVGQGYSNMGAIQAGAAMQPYNAIASGINTGLSVYGMQNMNNFMQNSTGAGTVDVSLPQIHR